MRTTLDIEDDVLFAAKELARRQKSTAGRVLSELARKGLTGVPEQAAQGVQEPGVVYGFRPFPKSGRILSNVLINKLREDGEY